MAQNIMRMIVLSTGHLQWSTVQLLEHTPVMSERYPVMGAPIPYGFLVYAHDDLQENIPDDLWACCVYARKQECDYIRFDAEEDVCDDLPDLTGTHPGAVTSDPPSDDVEVCRDCSAPLAEAGDGYDGRCPSCADRADVAA